jgi:toxin ParE1/3/4
MSNFWRVQLTDMAGVDLISIKIWTTEIFGAPQAAKYLEVIASAIEDLTIGPKPIGSKSREDIGPNIRSLHVQRKGNKGRHLLVYKEAKNQTIQVLRLLHDSMDLKGHSLESKTDPK